MQRPSPGLPNYIHNATSNCPSCISHPLLIPATWAATTPVVNIVSGIVESAVVVTNPGLDSRENPHFSRDVSKITDAVQISDVDLKSTQELASALIGPSTITGRGLLELNGILGEINNLKEELKKSLAEAKEKVGQHITEIFDTLKDYLEKFLRRIEEIQNGAPNSRRDVSKTAEETQRIAQGLLEILGDLSTLRGLVDDKIKTLTGEAREEAQKQYNEFRWGLGEFREKIMQVITEFLKEDTLVTRDV